MDPIVKLSELNWTAEYLYVPGERLPVALRYIAFEEAPPLENAKLYRLFHSRGEQTVCLVSVESQEIKGLKELQNTILKSRF